MVDSLVTSEQCDCFKNHLANYLTKMRVGRKVFMCTNHYQVKEKKAMSWRFACFVISTPISL